MRPADRICREHQSINWRVIDSLWSFVRIFRGQGAEFRCKEACPAFAGGPLFGPDPLGTALAAALAAALGAALGARGGVLFGCEELSSRRGRCLFLKRPPAGLTPKTTHLSHHRLKAWLIVGHIPNWLASFQPNMWNLTWMTCWFILLGVETLFGVGERETERTTTIFQVTHKIVA